ncbi:MAG: hypothetical protein P1U54_14865, partial [Immundisolibacteraceae bacterium]|nr:hypothetical protein [Immundisolibacteraceae bacterium]
MSCIVNVPIYGLDESNIPAWDGGARSVLNFAGDGYFRFTVDESVAGAVVGINTNDTSYHYSDIEYGFRFSRGGFRVIESGTFRDIPRTYVSGDVFFVIRVGGDVLYVRQTSPTYDPRYPGFPLPGPILYVSARKSYGQMFLDASLFEVDDYVYNESGGQYFIPQSTGPSSVSGEEAFFAGALPFTGFAAGSDTLGSFSGAASGGLGFELNAIGAVRTGVFEGLLPFVLWAGDNLRGWARGKLPFAGGLNNGAAITDGFQDSIGAKVRSVFGFGFDGNGGVLNPQGVLNGTLPFSVGAVGTSTNVFNGIVTGELPFSATAFSAMLSGNYLAILMPTLTGG